MSKNNNNQQPQNPKRKTPYIHHDEMKKKLKGKIWDTNRSIRTEKS